MSTSLVRTVALLTLITPLATLAQDATTTIIERAQQAGVGAPPTTEAPAEATKPTPGQDSDAGVQRVAEPRKLPFKINAYADQSLIWTDSVFLAPEDANDEGAAVATTSLGVGVRTLPRVVASGQLLFSAGFSYSRTLHGLDDENSTIRNLDFDSYALPLSASFRWGQGWEASASLTYSQLYSVRGAPNYEKLFESTTPALSLRKQSQLGRDMFLSLGGSLSYSDTWTSLRDVPAGLGYRHNRGNKIDASLNSALYLVRGNWMLSPSARVNFSRYIHYQEAGFNYVMRADTTAALDLELSYNFTSWASARLTAGYERRLSSANSISLDGFDYTYDSFSGGLGASLSVSF